MNFIQLDFDAVCAQAEHNSRCAAATFLCRRAFVVPRQRVHIVCAPILIQQTEKLYARRFILYLFAISMEFRCARAQIPAREKE